MIRSPATTQPTGGGLLGGNRQRDQSPLAGMVREGWCWLGQIGRGIRDTVGNLFSCAIFPLTLPPESAGEPISRRSGHRSGTCRPRRDWTLGSGALRQHGAGFARPRPLSLLAGPCFPDRGTEPNRRRRGWPNRAIAFTSLGAPACAPAGGTNPAGGRALHSTGICETPKFCKRTLDKQNQRVIFCETYL